MQKNRKGVDKNQIFMAQGFEKCKINRKGVDKNQILIAQGFEKC